MLLDGSRIDRDYDKIDGLKIPAPNDPLRFALIDDEVHAAELELIIAE